MGKGGPGPESWAGACLGRRHEWARGRGQADLELNLESGANQGDLRSQPGSELGGTGIQTTKGRFSWRPPAQPRLPQNSQDQ